MLFRLPDEKCLSVEFVLSISQKASDIKHTKFMNYVQVKGSRMLAK